MDRGQEKNPKCKNRGGGKETIAGEKASLWSPVCRSCHPLFVPLFLMLQSGVSHCISPGRGGKGKTGVRENDGNNKILSSGKCGAEKKKERMTGIDDTVNRKVNGQLTLKSEKLLYVNKQQQKKPHKSH